MNTSKVNAKVRVQRTCAMLAAAGITFTGITLISLLPAMAHAAHAGGPAPQLTARFADLNLSNQAGVTVLYRRIQHAA
jgi:UrcA family protein